MSRSRVLSLVVGGLLGGSAVLAPGAGAAPSSCQVHELPVPEGSTDAHFRGASNDGRTLLGEAISGQRTVPVLWRDGRIVGRIDDAPGPLLDLNAPGAGVGSGSRPWVYENGRVRELPGGANPLALNDAGQLAGTRSEESGATVPVTWPAGADRPVDLPGGPGKARDISQDGTIVGEAGTDPAPHVWRPDGTSAPLPMPPEVPANVQVVQVSGPWVVGAAPDGTLVRWNLDSGSAEVTPNAVVGGHTGVNERGWTLGSQDGGTQAVVFADGQVLRLPGLPEFPTHYADSISADGTVIGGTASTSKGPSKPVYWTCS